MTVGTLFLNGYAFVIVVNNSRSARSALSGEIRAAVAAKQFGCQQIIVLRLMSGRGFSVFRHLSLYTVKQLFRHNGGNTVWNDDIAEGVFPDIAAVVEHPLNAAGLNIAARSLRLFL